MSSKSFITPGARNQTEVYAIHGADPEVLAYAMAKYSRSALSMRESLTEISSQRAEQFLNTFYFQYGHRSIADLAHVAMAVERLSLLAAVVLVDEQRWDGQERSTRYQNFLESGWYFPDFGSDSASAQLYSETINGLFGAYKRVNDAVFDALCRRVACPESMKPEAYERTLKARAFDVARYLLPLATNTSLGQIVNARRWKPRYRGCSPTQPPRSEIWESSCAKPPPALPGRSMPRLAPPLLKSWRHRMQSWPPKPLTCLPARSALLLRWSNMPSPTTTRSRRRPNWPKRRGKF